MKNKVLILTKEAIEQKIKRLSYEILEDNYEEKEIVFVGIKENGLVFAEKIINYINSISKISTKLYSITLDKANPLSQEIKINADSSKLNNKTIIMVDDVANSGKTLCYALKPILECSPKIIQIAVLVDRKHKQFPVSADYIGLSLSTTMKEHITVNFAESNEAVFLQ
jgi:pyrimidine operon attenuation protein/uracil phosphoribosyltransferase